LSSETILRLCLTLGGLSLFALLEAAFPARARVLPRLGRWITNMSLGGVSSLAVRLMGPATVAGAALAAGEAGFGLFNQLTLPAWLVASLVLVLMDLAVWAQHLAMHKAPLLWRLHRVHHADRDLDVTSGLRFHPFEAAVSMAWKAAVVFVLGAPVAAALGYEILLSLMALFTHANLRLPARLERALRVVIVTPDMHRTHHSILRTEMDSNYGNALSLWDRLFRTYTSAPRGELVLGLGGGQDANGASLPGMLWMPLAGRRPAGG
jgi:sterol desaturase/sphingolipid hydroxylase (fatty acid hydroxylase superfamily)